MKAIFPSLLAILTTACLTGASAQAPLIPAPNPGVNPSAALPEAVDIETRFSLKFPGGAVTEFVEAISAAIGSPINVIIPEERAGTRISPIAVQKVSLSELFKAVSNASQREVAVAVTMGQNANIQFRKHGYKFETAKQPPKDSSLWYFIVEGDTQLPKMEVERSVRYFYVAEYLDYLTIDDLLTAINKGWLLQDGGKMTRDRESLPTLHFHQETSLLIASGSEREVSLIPTFLEALNAGLHVRVSAGELAMDPAARRRAAKIVIPKLSFQEAQLDEVASFLTKKSRELDSEQIGINVVVKRPPGGRELPKISLEVANITMLDAIKLVAALGNYILTPQGPIALLQSNGVEFSVPAGIPRAPTPAKPETTPR